MGFTREAESPCPRVEGPTPQLATKRPLVPGTGTYAWRPAPQEKLLLCVNVAGPGWASPEKRSRPAHGWKGRPRNWQRSARWYQVHTYMVHNTYPTLKPRHLFSTLKPRLIEHTQIFFWDVPIRNSLRSNNKVSTQTTKTKTIPHSYSKKVRMKNKGAGWDFCTD